MPRGIPRSELDVATQNNKLCNFSDDVSKMSEVKAQGEACRDQLESSTGIPHKLDFYCDRGTCETEAIPMPECKVGAIFRYPKAYTCVQRLSVMDQNHNYSAVLKSPSTLLFPDYVIVQGEK